MHLNASRRRPRRCASHLEALHVHIHIDPIPCPLRRAVVACRKAWSPAGSLLEALQSATSGRGVDPEIVELLKHPPDTGHVVGFGIKAVVGRVWIGVVYGPVESAIPARAGSIRVGIVVYLEGEVGWGRGHLGGGYSWEG